MPLEQATPANGMEASLFLVIAAFVLLAAAFIGEHQKPAMPGLLQALACLVWFCLQLVI